jgi:hypothetical protein
LESSWGALSDVAIGWTWPRLPCRPMSIPSDLSDFPYSCGNGTYVFEVSWMCVSRLECGKIEFLEKPSRISIACSVYLKNVFNVKVCCPPDQNPSNK